jgi:DNA polymerase-3 subunit beta
MKLTVLQEDLAKALNISSRFVSSRATLPVLSNILLQSERNKLYIVATNLEASVCLFLGSKGSDDGQICVPSKTFTELISSLPSGQISLESDGEKLRIASEGFSGSISGILGTEFPSVPRDIDQNCIKIPREAFFDALSKVLFAASNDETRPVLTGVLFIFDENNLTLVSSDGFRLSQKGISIKNSGGVRRMILPKTTLLEISRASHEVGDTFLMQYKEDENQVIFGIGGAVVATRVIEGDFPSFEKVIPKQSDISIHVDKESLVRAIKIASIFARDLGNVVKLKFGESSLEILAESSKVGGQKTRIDAGVEGGVLEISFNYRFIEEFLNVCGSEDVLIELTDSISPGVFKDTKDSGFLHLIMPVKI